MAMPSVAPPALGTSCAVAERSDVIGGWPPLNKKIDIEDKFDEVNFLELQYNYVWQNANNTDKGKKVSSHADGS